MQAEAGSQKPSAPVKTTSKKPSEPPADTPKDDTVIVKGERSLNRIDRQVYDTTKDPDSETGTTADALKKVPGVNVDPSGDVTLRGNDVEILINGKPSPLLSGDNRAAALRAMPSSMISSIEVMSNPGAQYGAQGPGGVINIVTRQAMPPGYFASLTGMLISNGGYAANGSAYYNNEKLTFSAFASVSQDHSRSRNGTSFSQLGGNGLNMGTTQSAAAGKASSRGANLNATLDYALNERDTLTGQYSYYRSLSDTGLTGHAEAYDAAGVATELYGLETISGGVSGNQSLGVTWTHVGQKLGDGLKIDARLTRINSAFDGHNRFDYELSQVIANQGLREQSSRSANQQTTANLSVDYNTSLGDDQITSGLQITREEVREDSLNFDPYTPGVGTPVINPALSNRFVYDQTLSAAYVTYQKAMGTHWALLGGLRSETLAYNSRADLTAAPVHVTYSRLNPSVFATYVISDTRKVRLNYSQRLQRPSPRDLNPSLTYVNLQTVRVGAPALKPQETHSFEASYEYSREMINYSLRAYHLRNNKVINPVSTIINDPLNPGNPIIQTTRRNAGHSQQTGMQFAYSDSLGSKWTLNTSGNAYVTHIHVPDMPQAQSLTTTSAQISLDYRTSEHSNISWYYSGQGRQLTGEGYSPGYASASLQYNHRLGAFIDLSISVMNMLRNKTTTFRSTPSVRSFNYNIPPAPTFQIVLSRRFSGGSFAAPKQP